MKAALSTFLLEPRRDAAASFARWCAGACSVSAQHALSTRISAAHARVHCGAIAEAGEDPSQCVPSAGRICMRCIHECAARGKVNSRKRRCIAIYRGLGPRQVLMTKYSHRSIVTSSTYVCIHDILSGRPQLRGRLHAWGCVRTWVLRLSRAAA